MNRDAYEDPMALSELGCSSAATSSLTFFDAAIQRLQVTLTHTQHTHALHTTHTLALHTHIHTHYTRH